MGKVEPLRGRLAGGDLAERPTFGRIDNSIKRSRVYSGIRIRSDALDGGEGADVLSIPLLSTVATRPILPASVFG